MVAVVLTTWQLQALAVMGEAGVLFLLRLFLC